MSHRTCKHDAMPEPIPGAPLDRSHFYIPYWNQSLVGMKQCCSPNEVHIAGEGDYEGCVLWCLIPDHILGKDGNSGAVNKRENHNKEEQEEDDDDDDDMYENAVRSAMGYCVWEKGKFANKNPGVYIAGAHVVRDNAAASSKAAGSKGPTLLAVGVWALLVIGLLA